MKFVQIVEFSTGRIDEFNTGLDDWMARTMEIGYRMGGVEADRDATDRFLLLVEFDSFGKAWRIRHGLRLGSCRVPCGDQRLCSDLPQSGRAT